MDPFGTRLRAALADRGPLCVGIDPHPELLTAWGLPVNAGGLDRFALAAVDAVADLAAVVKPQSAFFERFGSAGVTVLERVIERAGDAGALVIVDAKRGDIGSTMDAYAAAYADPASPLAGDAVTVSPYLGFATLTPVIDTALRHGRGVFALAYTSNPDAGTVQRATGTDGRSVGRGICDEVARVNATELAAGAPLGSVGVVIGATVPDGGGDLPDPLGPILAPGLGAQGATPADLASRFAGRLADVIPASSRGVLRHGPDRAALRSAVDTLTTTLRAAFGTE